MEQRTPSILRQLREQVPLRALTPAESRQILERQATLLLKLAQIPGPAVPVEQVIGVLPRTEVKRAHGLPTSGRTQWSGSRWVLLVDADEPGVRQRFSLAHELAHVIYHPLAADVLPDRRDLPAEVRLERACEYFAACLLMPRLWMKRAYFHDGIQDIPSLSRLFGVSWSALEVRLEQLGFVERPQKIGTAA